MLSRYKKIGQFTYFDIRNTEHDLIIDERVTKDKWKLVSVAAIVKEDKNSKNDQFELFYKLYINYVTK